METPVTAKSIHDLDDDLGNLINSPVREQPAQAPAGHKPMAFTEKCRKCGGSGSFFGRSGLRMGQCFTCKGTGMLTFKTSTDTRAKKRASNASKKAAQIAAFKAEHPDVWAWMDGSTFQPAIEMRADLEKFGSLFDSRIEFAKRMIARRDETRTKVETERKERETNAQTVNVDALTEAFAKASRRNKRVGLWIGSIKISPAKAGSKWEGSLYVRDKAQDAYLGRITAGRFVPSHEGRARETELLAIMQDPKAAAIAHGKLTGACSVCSRTLTDPDSIAAGIGPICAEGFGW